jgi:hypothetical protein
LDVAGKLPRELPMEDLVRLSVRERLDHGSMV